MEVNVSLFGQAITFFILVWATMKFVWPPLVKVLDERATRIAEGLAYADRAKQDLDNAERAAAKKIREAKQQASEIIAQAEKRATQLIEAAKANAKIEGDRLISGARAELDQQIEQAREGLRMQVADLVIASAEKILTQEIDAAKHAQFLSSLKTRL